MVTVFWVIAYIAVTALSVRVLAWLAPDSMWSESDAAPLVLLIAALWPITVPMFAIGRLVWAAATYKPAVKPKPDPVKRLDRDIAILEDMKRQVDRIGH